MSVLEDVFKGSGLDKETHSALRKQIYSKNKTLVQGTDIVISPEDIGTAENGRLIIQYKSTDYECFYYKKDSSDKLYVILNGARNENEPLPIHKRWSYYNYIDGTTLNVADPMLRAYEGMRLGWYYGNDEVCYASQIAEFAKIVAAKLEKKEIIFFGSSAGGYAALLAACNCTGSTAVVINPQIKPSLWWYKTVFENITGIKITDGDKFYRNDLPKLIQKSVKSRFIIISNTYSDDDNVQISTVCEQFDKDVGYGLNRLSDNVLIWMYGVDFESPHNAIDYPEIFFAIDYLYKHFDESERLKELFFIFDELWADHWEAEQQLRELREFKRTEEIKNGRKKSREVSVVAMYDGTNHSVKQKLLKKEHCFIEAADGIWNNECIYDEIIKNKLYKIEMKNPVLSGYNSKYSLTMRDNVTNDLIMDITLPARENRTVIINTEKLSHSAKLKLYSGVVGKTDGISLEADVAIYEIDII